MILTNSRELSNLNNLPISNTSTLLTILDSNRYRKIYKGCVDYDYNLICLYNLQSRLSAFEITYSIEDDSPNSLEVYVDVYFYFSEIGETSCKVTCYTGNIPKSFIRSFLNYLNIIKQ
jgi:hypothetical protein